MATRMPSAVRTCKCRRDYPRKAFVSLDAVQVWMQQLVGWYNHGYWRSAPKFTTPVQLP